MTRKDFDEPYYVPVDIPQFRGRGLILGSKSWEAGPAGFLQGQQTNKKANGWGHSQEAAGLEDIIASRIGPNSSNSDSLQENFRKFLINEDSRGHWI